MDETQEIGQAELEQKIKEESAEVSSVLQQLESEKITLDESHTSLNHTPLRARTNPGDPERQLGDMYRVDARRDRIAQRHSKDESDTEERPRRGASSRNGRNSAELRGAWAEYLREKNESSAEKENTLKTDLEKEALPKFELKKGEIRGDKWQRIVDEAFQKNDYDTLDALEKVMPDIRPSKLLISAQLQSLLTGRDSGWIDKVQRVKKIGDSEDCDHIIALEFKRVLEIFDGKAHDRKILEALARLTTADLLREAVQEKYKKIISANSASHKESLIEDIERFSKIKPDETVLDECIEHGAFGQVVEAARLFKITMTEEIAQRTFAAQFDKSGIIETYYIKKFGFVPSEETVHRAYRHIIDPSANVHNALYRLRELKMATRVDPRLTQEEIATLYAYCSIDRDLEDIKATFDFLGDRPSEEIVQEIVARIATNDRIDIKELGRTIAQLEVVIGSKVEISQQTAQKIYRWAIEKKRPKLVLSLAKDYGLKPENLDPEKVRDFMLNYIDKSSGEMYLQLQQVFGTEHLPRPDDIVHKYRENLEKYDITGIKTIDKVTGVKLQFDDEPLQATYKELLAKGNFEKINQLKEYSGVGVMVDDAAMEAAAQGWETRLKSMFTGDSLDASVVQAVSELILMRDLVDMRTSMKALYMSNRSSLRQLRESTISKLVEMTGVKSVFTDRDISDMARYCLQRGRQYELSSLSRLGTIAVERQTVVEGYQKLLETLNTKEILWFNRFTSIYKSTHIPPTDEQSRQIADILSKDRAYFGQDEADDIDAAIDYVVSAFEIRDRSIFASLASRVVTKAETKVEPKVEVTVSKQTVQENVESLLKGYRAGTSNRTLEKLNEILQKSGLEKLPADDEVIQEVYNVLADEKNFGLNSVRFKCDSYALYQLTGIRPKLTPDQVKKGFYNAIKYSSYGARDEFSQMVGDEIIQKLVLDEVASLLESGEIVKAIYFARENNYEIPEEILHREAQDQFIRYTSRQKDLFEFIEKIEEVMGKNLRVDDSKVDHVLQQMLKMRVRDSFSASDSAHSNAATLLVWMVDHFHFQPSPELIDLVYVATWKLHADKSAVKIEKIEYNSVWRFIEKRFGKPSVDAIQAVYAEQILNSNASFLESRAQAVINFSKIDPDINTMSKISSRYELRPGESDIHDRLQAIYKNLFLSGDINGLIDLQNRYNVELKIEGDELQALYAQILLKPHGKAKDLYDFLVWHSGVLPSDKIIQARYEEILSAGRPNIQDAWVFFEIVQVPPPDETIQNTYKRLFEKYVKSRGIESEDGDYYDSDDRILVQITELSHQVGVSLKLDKEFVMSMYELCLKNDGYHHSKLATIMQRTGITIDMQLIRKHVLENKRFTGSISFPISPENLDEHFSVSENRSIAEYKRIYIVFGCYEYYQNLLSKLEQTGTNDAKRQVIKILTAMGLRDMKQADRYKEIKQKILDYGSEKGNGLDKTVSIALAEFADRGDEKVIEYLVETLRKPKTDEQQGEERRVSGFTDRQIIALRALMRLDNPTANEALLSLVFKPETDTRIKAVLMKNLLEEKRGFFPLSIQSWIKEKLANDPASYSWDDLKCFHAILRIPSADVRRKSKAQVHEAFKQFSDSDRSVAQTQKDIGRYIPENTFLQLWKFVGQDEALVTKFNTLYAETKSSTSQESLLFSIVNVLAINSRVQEKVLDRLRRFDFISNVGAQQVTRLLKAISFLDTVAKYVEEGDGSEILQILDEPVESIEQLNVILQNTVVRKIKDILPHEAIDADKVQELWEKWGSLEPIFIYAAKMASSGHTDTLHLVAEMVAHMDPPAHERWKAWRYNKANPVVQRQIGNLTSEQLEVWKTDRFVEMGDVAIDASVGAKSQQIASLLENAIREGHIYNPAIGTSDKYKFIQERLSQAQESIATQPERKEQIMAEEIRSLQEDMGKIDSLIKGGNLSRIKEAVDMFATGSLVLPNKKASDAISHISSLLSEEQKTAVLARYQSLEKMRKDASNTDLKVNEFRSNSNEAEVQKLVDFYNPLFPSSPHTLKGTLKTLESESPIYLTIKSEGKVIGLLESNEETTNGKNVRSLLTIGVDPEHRRQGLATRLISELKTKLKQGETVVVHFREGNKDHLESFYAEQGFTGLTEDGAYSNGETKYKMTFVNEPIFSPDILEQLRLAIDEIASDYQKIIESDIFDKYGLDREQSKNTGQLYRIRQELKILLDLYRLRKLNPQLIAINRITDSADKKGEAITTVVDNLEKFFKDNLAFLQDIDNVQNALIQKTNPGSSLRLGMMITDNPQMLFQVGKYPTGCGSCQNYEGTPDLNKALAGYVADAHTKVMYLIDMNKLSSSSKQRIEEVGFAKAKEEIPVQELLEASVGRSVVKLVQEGQDEKVALFMEPTYTQLNKSDNGMDKYFDACAKLMISDPMSAQLMRGDGNVTVTVPSSRNPSGQYEDAAAGYADNAGMGIQRGRYKMPARVII